MSVCPLPAGAGAEFGVFAVASHFAFAHLAVWPFRLAHFPVDGAAILAFVFAIDALITAAGAHLPSEAALDGSEHFGAAAGAVALDAREVGGFAALCTFEADHADGYQLPATAVVDAGEYRVAHAPALEDLAAMVADRWIGLIEIVTARW